MRERMFATIGIWLAVAFSINPILTSLRYTISTPVESVMDYRFQPLFNVETAFVSGEMQVATYIILALIILCAMGATIAIWEKAHASEEAKRSVTIRESQKAKRDRQMRIRRLLATMDEGDLAALEEQHIGDDVTGDDGEQMTVEQLLENRRKRS